jgi:hypothetical protein
MSRWWGRLRWSSVRSVRSCSVVALRWRWGSDESTRKEAGGGAHRGRGSAAPCLWVSDEVGDAPTVRGGQMVEGHHEEGGGSLCAVWELMAAWSKGEGTTVIGCL